MSSWKPRLVDNARMKYLGIVEALEADVRAGQVAPGDRLPSQRAIAEALQVDLTTVTRAFAEAQRRGLVDAHAGRGSFIRDDLGATRRPGPFEGMPRLDLSMNIPPQPAAARLSSRIPGGIASLLSSPRGMLHLHYQESTGTEADRAAAFVWLGRRIDGLSTSRILVAPGAQSALFAICECLFRTGDSIAAGAFTYPGLKAIAAQKGLSLVPIAMDEGGLIPDAFEEICRKAPPRALYIIPSIDNPTTATLSEKRRLALIEIARRHDVTIIEDDPYTPLLESPPPSFAELAGDITWHVATLSKCATPALRIAYVVTPTDAQALRLAGVLRATNLMASPLMAALASQWITSGTLHDISATIAEENGERQKLAASILHGHSFAADPRGHHLWLRLPELWRASDFAEHAGRLGVAIVPAPAFSIATPAEQAVRVSLGVAPDRGALEDALTLLAGLIGQPSLAMRTVV